MRQIEERTENQHIIQKWVPFTVREGYPPDIYPHHTCRQDRWGTNEPSTLQQDLVKLGYKFPDKEQFVWSLSLANIAELLYGKRIRLDRLNKQGNKIFVIIQLHKDIQQNFIGVLPDE